MCECGGTNTYFCAGLNGTVTNLQEPHVRVLKENVTVVERMPPSKFCVNALNHPMLAIKPTAQSSGLDDYSCVVPLYEETRFGNLTKGINNEISGTKDKENRNISQDLTNFTGIREDNVV